MENEVINYLEMCSREGISLQQGMNFASGNGYSIILMSVRPNAPYRDQILDEGSVLVYEGHDVPRADPLVNPKVVDQPERTGAGGLTQNGKFHQAAQAYKRGERSAERVRVYEKIKAGIWSYNGLFELVDSWVESDGTRNVFRYKLVAVEDDSGPGNRFVIDGAERRRLIPTHVKVEVWKRDKGRCVQCGATDELHFDHIIPYSRGGTSMTADNIQLLCARHNLAKRDKIE